MATLGTGRLAAAIANTRANFSRPRKLAEQRKPRRSGAIGIEEWKPPHVLEIRRRLHSDAAW